LIVWFWGRAHGKPPNCGMGLSQFLVLPVSPTPHVFEQAEYGLQAPQSPSKEIKFEYTRSQNIKQIIRTEPNYSNIGCHLKNQILKSPWRKYQITRYKEFCKITFHYWTFIILFKALREPHIWNLFQCTLIEEIRTLLLHLFQLY